MGRSDITEEQFQKCVQYLDKNGNGVITKNNFIEYVPYLYEVDFNPPVVKTNKKNLPKLDTSDPANIFVKVKKIGKGSFGQVFEAIDTRTNNVFFLSFFQFEKMFKNHKSINLNHKS